VDGAGVERQRGRLAERQREDCEKVGAKTSRMSMRLGGGEGGGSPPHRGEGKEQANLLAKGKSVQNHGEYSNALAAFITINCYQSKEGMGEQKARKFIIRTTRSAVRKSPTGQATPPKKE